MKFLSANALTNIYMKSYLALFLLFTTQTTFAQKVSTEIIQSQGFSGESFFRGLLGMVVLITISFILSNNRKAIKWKNVGIGLAFQLIIAIGVLKVPFIMKAFEYVGQGFISILKFTQTGIGEIVGGSQREERLEVLKEKMAALDIPKDELWWYLDLRTYGTAVHSGFGLGFERLVMFAAGMGNIRDVIPYPRTPQNAEF